MIYLQLLLSFMKIGLFSFGGGYAMIPLIQKEIESHGWLSSSQFVDIIAIAEMTPGPIAVNSATFVGYSAAGILGGMVATLGVALPSMLLILMVSKFFYRFQHHPANQMMFYGIRPVIVGLVSSAALFVAQTTFIHQGGPGLTKNPLAVLDFKSILIFIFSWISLAKFKLHPILIIIACGVLGLVLY